MKTFSHKRLVVYFFKSRPLRHLYRKLKDLKKNYTTEHELYIISVRPEDMRVDFQGLGH